MPATLKKGIKPVTDYKQLGSKKGVPRYLYHATIKDHLESIQDFGLVRGFLKGVPGWYKDQDFIWLDPKPVPLKQWLKEYYPDWDWSIVRINTDYLETSKLFRKRSYTIRKWGKRTFKDVFAWYIYKGDIPPEAVHVVG